MRLWYQYYFHTERGRNGLTEKRREISRLLWKMWSPSWAFDDATFDRSAVSFDNADFVDVVVHSYRHRTGSVAGDPRYASVEARLAAQPTINVPTINLHGAVDGVNPLPATDEQQIFHCGISAPRAGPCRPQSATGSAAGLCRRDPAASAETPQC